MGMWTPGLGPTAGDDTFTGDGTNETANGGGGNDTLLGDAGADALFGGAGNDILNGGAGLDQLYGGEGDDEYYVDVSGDVTYEANSAWGIDTVRASATYTLGANIDNLVLLGVDAFNGTGNVLANTMTGNSAANTLFGLGGDDILDGGVGADQMYGGEGDDTYNVDNVGDVVFEASDAWGMDTVNASVNFTLSSNIEHLTLTGAAAITGKGNANGNTITGNGAANALFGYGGDDRLDGGAGADQMYGGEGDDTYIVDNSSDTTFEADANWGTDTVQASATYTLGANIDNLFLMGSANINGSGNALANSITGNGGLNVLFGYGGDDTLNGGVGADQMYGGEGDDTYFVDNAGDVAFEAQSTWGTDIVFASVNYTISANMDQLYLVGTATSGFGNALNNTIVGNGNANALYGYAGNDVLDGGTGADQMFGGEGDDEYIVDNAGDVGFEASAAQGADSVTASVSHTLGENLDILFLAGEDDLNGTGNAIANELYGNGGANVLAGAGGNDLLYGYTGNDTLTGGAGDDSFVFVEGSGGDTITDFVAGGVEDSLNLSYYDGSGVTWSITQDGANTVFSFTNGDVITLLNVDMTLLVQNDPFGFS